MLAHLTLAAEYSQGVAESQTKVGISLLGRSIPHFYCLLQAGNKPTCLKNRLVSNIGPCTPEDSIDRLTASPWVSADNWQRRYGCKAMRDQSTPQHVVVGKGLVARNTRPAISIRGICSRLRQQYRGFLGNTSHLSSGGSNWASQQSEGFGTLVHLNSWMSWGTFPAHFQLSEE